MEIKVIGSNSKGNCYIINGELLLDAGVPIKDIKIGLDFDLSKVVGCLVTHSHKDHNKSVKDLVKSGIMCYMNGNTIEETGIEDYNIKNHNYTIFKLDYYLIKPFECYHDVQCTGYLIIDTRTKESIVFATDTMQIPYEFSNATAYLIEANYSEEILNKKMENGEINTEMAKRVFHTHFSFENCMDFLQTQDLSKTKKIILIHLSDDNSDEKRFKEECEEITDISTICANAGDIIKI